MQHWAEFYFLFSVEALPAGVNNPKHQLHQLIKNVTSWPVHSPYNESVDHRPSEHLFGDLAGSVENLAPGEPYFLVGMQRRKEEWGRKV